MFRRIAALAMALAALCPTARALQSLCLVAPPVVALIDEWGDALIEGDAIEDVFPVREGALYAAGSKGDYRLYGVDGTALGDTRFSMIDDQGDCLIFRADGLYGAMDATGRVTLAAEWTQLTCDGAGGFLALDADPLDDRPDEIVRVDAGGDAERTGVYTACGLSRVISDRMPFMDAQGRYGAVDGSGNIVIPAQWRAIGPFEGGVAQTAGTSGAGLIDTDGAVLVPPVYSWLERGVSMIAARSDSGVEAFSPDGARLLFSVEGEGLEASLAGDYLRVSDGERARLYDALGEIVAEFDAGTSFAPGVGEQLIASDGAWGERCQWLMAPDGSAVSERYQRLLPLCEGRYAYMEMDGAEYYSADLDRLQWSWDYDSLRWGLLSEAGELLLPARYQEIRALGADRLLLLDGETVRLADLDGKIIQTWPAVEAEAPTGEADA